MDYTKLHWYSDWMYSEVIGDVSEEKDIVIGLYSIRDFPEVHMYVDVENMKIIDVWVSSDDE